MRILAHVHGYPPVHAAGAEYALHGLLTWLLGRGHEVQVYAPSRAQSGEFEGVRVTLSTDTAVLRDLYRWADLVITHLDLTRNAIALSRLLHKPLAHYVHNDRQLAFHHAGRADAGLVIWNSQWIADQARWQGRQCVVWPPVWEETYRVKRPASACQILLANLNRNKGADTFWALARRLPARAFLGIRGAYEQQIVAADSPRNVTVEPNTGDMRAVYARTRIALMPSAYESWGRVAMEAAVNGIPVICHPTVGLQECLGDAGIYVDRADVDGYARAIAALDDPQAYQAASAAIRQRYLAYLPLLEQQLAACELLMGEAAVERRDRPLEYAGSEGVVWLARRRFSACGWMYEAGSVVTGLDKRVAETLERRGIIDRMAA